MYYSESECEFWAWTHSKAAIKILKIESALKVLYSAFCLPDEIQARISKGHCYRQVSVSNSKQRLLIHFGLVTKSSYLKFLLTYSCYISVTIHFVGLVKGTKLYYWFQIVVYKKIQNGQII